MEGHHSSYHPQQMHPAQVMRMAIQQQQAQRNSNMQQHPMGGMMGQQQQFQQQQFQQQQFDIQRFQEQQRIRHQHHQQLKLQQQQIMQQQQQQQQGAGLSAGQYAQLHQQPQRQVQQPQLRVQQPQQQKKPLTAEQQERLRRKHPPGSKVTDVRIITHCMEKIVPNPSKEYQTLFQALPFQLAFIIQNCVVFKFESRDPSPDDPGKYSTDAYFFLQKLATAHASLVKKPMSLMGLRCACCFRAPNYIAGSTNFIDLTDSNAFYNLLTIIRSRKTHLSACPFVDNTVKGRLFSYKTSNTEKKILSDFLEMWLRLARENYYQHIFQPAPIDSGIKKILDSLEVTEESLEDDLTTAFTAARKMKGTEIVIDKLDEIGVPTGKESPCFEDFLVGFQVRIMRRDNEFQIGFDCRHCDNCIGGHLQFKDLLDLSKEMWDRVGSHYAQCVAIPESVKGRFEARDAEKPPIDDLVSFFKVLTTQLQQILRWTIPNVTPKHDVDVFRPVPIETLREYEPLPCRKGRVEKHKEVLPVRNLRSFDVIMGSEMHRDLEGNRRFRQMISQHRPLFLQLSPLKQELVARTLEELVRRQGGEFCTLDNAGVKYQVSAEKRLEYVMHSLKNGFPEMLRDPIDRNARSKVQQLYFAPRIGMMYRDVCWDAESRSASRYKITDFLKRGEQVDTKNEHSSPLQRALRAPKSVSGEVIVIDSDDDKKSGKKQVETQNHAVAKPQNSTSGHSLFGGAQNNDSALSHSEQKTSQELGSMQSSAAPHSKSSKVNSSADNAVGRSTGSTANRLVDESQGSDTSDKALKGVEPQSTPELLAPGEREQPIAENRPEKRKKNGDGCRENAPLPSGSEMVDLCEVSAVKRPRLDGAATSAGDTAVANGHTDGETLAKNQTGVSLGSQTNESNAAASWTVRRVNGLQNHQDNSKPRKIDMEYGEPVPTLPVSDSMGNTTSSTEHSGNARPPSSAPELIVIDD